MPNQHDTLGACGINQRRHIVHKMRQSIVSDLRGPGGAPVSALIDRPDAIAHSCRYRYLVPPGDGVLGKACRQSANCLRCPPPAPRSATCKVGQEPMVRGLSAGAEWIRTSGSAREWLP